MAGIVGRVVEVTDGDTLVVQVDTMPLFGRDGMLLFHVRLLGVNAPEIATDPGKAAKQWVTTMTLGKDCLVAIAHPDKFRGRLDCDVWLAGDATTLSQRIIDAGHGVFYDGGKR
jgi:endonuclease YncB( thermonuclease family)